MVERFRRPGTVTINVSLADPIAVDDSYTFPASDLANVQASIAGDGE